MHAHVPIHRHDHRPISGPRRGRARFESRRSKFRKTAVGRTYRDASINSGCVYGVNENSKGGVEDLFGGSGSTDLSLWIDRVIV